MFFVYVASSSSVLNWRTGRPVPTASMRSTILTCASHTRCGLAEHTKRIQRQVTYLATLLDGVGDGLDVNGVAEMVPRGEVVAIDTVKKVELLDERVFEALTRVRACGRVAYPPGRFAETGKVFLGRGGRVVGEPNGGEPCKKGFERGWCARCVNVGHGR